MLCSYVIIFIFYWILGITVPHVWLQYICIVKKPLSPKTDLTCGKLYTKRWCLKSKFFIAVSQPLYYSQKYLQAESIRRCHKCSLPFLGRPSTEECECLSCLSGLPFPCLPCIFGDLGDLGDLGVFGDFGDLGDLGDLGEMCSGDTDNGSALSEADR